MPALQRCCQTLIVASQAAKTSEPTEGAFDDPASRQQQKASLRFVVFDDDEFYPRANAPLRVKKSVLQRRFVPSTLHK